MECQRCQTQVSETDRFCGNCGLKISEILKESVTDEIKSEIAEAFQSIKTAQFIPKSQIPVAPSDYSPKSLTPHREEHIRLLNDTSSEMGVSIDDSKDFSENIVIEYDEAPVYYLNEMCNINFRVTNTSDTKVNDLKLSCFFNHSGKENARNVKFINTGMQKILSFSYDAIASGTESIDVQLEYIDDLGNPFVYSGQLQIRIYDREKYNEGAKSITFSINANNLAADMSGLGAMTPDYDKLLNQSNLKKPTSSYIREYRWSPFPMVLDEYATKERKDALVIAAKLQEAEDNLKEAESLKIDADERYKTNKEEAVKKYTDCINYLREAELCYKKVCEINPRHEAIKKIKGISSLISDVERGIERATTKSLEPSETPKPQKPKINLTSAVFYIVGHNQCIYLFSKSTITLGMNSKNDIPLRLYPYKWKPEFSNEIKRLMSENKPVNDWPDSYFPSAIYKQNLILTNSISQIHAEIINKSGVFYIRDIGTDKKGSTNGTFIDGKQIKPFPEEYQIKDHSIINIAGCLELECHLFWRSEKKEYSRDACVSVFGDLSDNCFGIDKQGELNALKLKRINNYKDEEQYIILVREITVGSSPVNGIVVEHESISPFHAKIFYRDNHYWIEDLNSRQGTWVNGHEVKHGQEMSLGDNAEIVLGNVKIEFKGKA